VLRVGLNLFNGKIEAIFLLYYSGFEGLFRGLISIFTLQINFMSFWKRLFGGNKTNGKNSTETEHQNLLDMVMPETGIILPRALANHWDEIKKTGRETIRIVATPSDKLTLRQSKFGHYPCIPKNYNYPKDKEGNFMFPLAQINFSEVPKLEGFPESGYLQFYIQAGDTFGLSFDEKIPSDFKVLFFEESEVQEIEEDFSFLNEVLKSDYSPVNCPHSLIFEGKREYIGIGDFQGERSGYFNFDSVLNEHKDIANKLEDIFFETFLCSGHKIGGYAYFTQEDPRAYYNSKQDYQLLFQMDSGNEIMWGDVGVANFFIHPDKLAKKDFSEVLYNWDCC
jgi:uncharacterized protein YwqG